MPASCRHFRIAGISGEVGYLYATMLLECGSQILDLSVPRVMGILNVTPDSFSDGGRFTSKDTAVAHALRMVEAGADFVDVGGESTRPGAEAISEEEELRRVIPIIELLASRVAIPLSIDTSKPRVMREAVAAGATLINDVYALRAHGALQTAAELPAAICLMHMQGEPRTMQRQPQYTDVVAEVHAFLNNRLEACTAIGISPNRVLLDPGIGFGKQVQHNLALVAHVAELRRHRPVLIGVSRKSMLGTLLGRPINERLAGGLAVAVAAVLAGTSVIRTHDVPETVDAIKIAAALKRDGYHL
jgi:dihydropteroate synthase